MYRSERENISVSCNQVQTDNRLMNISMSATGMKITYTAGPDSTPETVTHGCMENGKVDGFELQENERIVIAKLLTGHCVDSMTFRTSSKRSLGPFGGSDGGPNYFRDFSSRRTVWLAFFKGAIYTDDDGTITLRQVRIAWSNRPINDINLRETSQINVSNV